MVPVVVLALAMNGAKEPVVESHRDEDDDLLIVMVTELVDECHDGPGHRRLLGVGTCSDTPGPQRVHCCSICWARLAPASPFSSTTVTAITCGLIDSAWLMTFWASRTRWSGATTTTSELGPEDDHHPDAAALQRRPHRHLHQPRNLGGYAGQLAVHAALTE